MSENVRTEPLPVAEMKLVHDVHRGAATSLEVAAVLAGLPAPAARALPAMRERARTTLSALRAGQQVGS